MVFEQFRVILLNVSFDLVKCVAAAPAEGDICYVEMFNIIFVPLNRYAL